MFRQTSKIGQLASQLFLISQVYPIASFIEVYKNISVSSHTFRLLIGFVSVIAICKHEDQSYANDRQGSNFIK